MAQQLTADEDEHSLVRPKAVEDQIDAVLKLAPAALRARLAIIDRRNSDHIHSETLVHLVRHGRRVGDQNLITLVLPVLLGRCEANLLIKVPDGQLPEAASLREEILCSFSELFASDSSGDNPNELNFYECRFNRAFKFFRIDMVRREIARLKPITQMPTANEDGEPGPHDEVFARVSEAFRTMPTQEPADQERDHARRHRRRRFSDRDRPGDVPALPALLPLSSNARRVAHPYLIIDRPPFRFCVPVSIRK